eukprot:234004-Amphidinium_carterae.1
MRKSAARVATDLNFNRRELSAPPAAGLFTLRMSFRRLDILVGGRLITLNQDHMGELMPHDTVQTEAPFEDPFSTEMMKPSAPPAALLEHSMPGV